MKRVYKIDDIKPNTYFICPNDAFIGMMNAEGVINLYGCTSPTKPESMRLSSGYYPHSGSAFSLLQGDTLIKETQQLEEFAKISDTVEEYLFLIKLSRLT